MIIKIPIYLEIAGKFSEEDLEVCKQVFGYNFTEELKEFYTASESIILEEMILEFIREYKQKYDIQPKFTILQQEEVFERTFGKAKVTTDNSKVPGKVTTIKSKKKIN